MVQWPVILYQKRIPPDANLPLSLLIPSKRLKLNISSWALEKFRNERFIENYWIYLDTAGEYNIENHFKRVRGAVVMLPRQEKSKIISINKKIKNANSLKKFTSIIEGENKKDRLIILFFSIQRNGKILMRIIEKRTTIIIEKGKEDSIYNMCYRFIKDIFHIHKHHDKYEDNIIEAVKINKEYKNGAWMMQVYRSMLRYIIRNRYQKGYNILGMISYLKSSQMVIKKCGTATHFPTMEEVENLENSIQFSKKEEEANLSSDRWLYGSIIAVLYFVIGFHSDIIKNIIKSKENASGVNPPLESSGMLLSSHDVFVIFTFSLLVMNFYFWRRILITDIVVKIMGKLTEMFFSVCKKFFKGNCKVTGIVFISISFFLLYLAM